MTLYMLLIIPWILTVVIEGGTALIFYRIKGKGQILLFLVNTVTNPAAVLFCLLVPAYTEMPFYAAVLIAEILVFITEGLLLWKCMGNDEIRPWRTAFVLNIISFGVGLLISLLSQPLTVSADVIFEPENNFYEIHSDECYYFNRPCIAGDDTCLWDAPNLTTEGEKLQEGDSIYISFVYTDNDGLEWGLAETQDKWILMADLYLEYGSPEFMEEHSDEIYEDEPYLLSDGTVFVSWSYPESGVINSSGASVTDDYEITTFYTDPDGRLWGYTAYMYGTRDVWICLSDMSDTNIPQRVEHELIPAQEADASQIAAVKESGQFSVLFLVVPVIIIAGIAGFLIWWFWIRKKRLKRQRGQRML